MGFFGGNRNLVKRIEVAPRQDWQRGTFTEPAESDR
jgi:hypothetical protein